MADSDQQSCADRSRHFRPGPSTRRLLGRFTPHRPGFGRLRRAFLIALGGLVGLAVVVCLTGYLLVRGSLAQVNGRIALPGLDGDVQVSRDAHGVPTIVARNELDAWRVLGFVEAQDRFFQMDLMRRSAAGELAGLVGPRALPLDRERARFNLRERAERIYLNSPPAERARLDAFTLGVNEGLERLAVRPWPYLLLRNTPVRWRPTDCILAIYAMAFTLQDPAGRRQRSLAALEALYPPAVVQFLMAPDTDWATPMAGKPPALPPIPGTASVDLAAATGSAANAASVMPPVPASGSNSFAVAGGHTRNGLALLANDMHLPLGVPPVWYRARLEFPARGDGGEPVKLTGVFLPGVPALVAGTNGHVAWGLTNSYGDWVDLVRVPSDASRTAPESAATAELQAVKLRIAVRGGPDRYVRVMRTRWGPVVGTAPDGSLLASHWSLLQPGGVNLTYFKLENAHSVSEALAIAARSGIPAQNFLAADSAGHIGWTIAGRIPARRPNCDYSVPQSWADGHCGWDGWLTVDAYPRIVDPPQGYLVTANNRVDDTSAGDLEGNGGYADGARAHQIAADLSALLDRGDVDPEDLLAVQLDDRAEFLARWQALALRVLQPSALQYHPEREAFRKEIADWGGSASIHSVGYRLVREFRDQVADDVFAPILSRLKTRYPRAELPFAAQLEGPLWRLVTNRPENWLNPEFPTWNALFLNAIDGVAARLWSPRTKLAEATWGRRNTVRVDHPLAGALGPLGHWLNMPVLELPGDVNMPRVQAPEFGASMRMVAVPAATAAGIFELPGGESGHPLSVWYADEFAAWAHGIAEPLAPGPMQAHMTFVPSPTAATPSHIGQN